MTDREKDTVLFLRIARDLKVTETTIGIEMVKTLYDLITQQQTEIIMLRKELGIGDIYKDIVVRTRTLDDYNKFKNAVKSDTIKEFAERYRKEILSMTHSNSFLYSGLVLSIFNNLVEEMTKEADNETVRNS